LSSAFGRTRVQKICSESRFQAASRLEQVIPRGREAIAWPATASVLVLCRLCHPSSELHIAEHFYAQSALSDLLGVPIEKVNESRPYRAMDKLLPHKRALEIHPKNRLGELFNLEYDLLLYDVTSTYFEGEANGNARARRGYFRDRRSDCKQVCIALVVSRCGMPLGYEVFSGNRADVTTVQEIVEAMEWRYGKANRIWVMDRGMASTKNFEFLMADGRKYILGANRGQLKAYETELLKKDWQKVQTGLIMQPCAAGCPQKIFAGVCYVYGKRYQNHVSGQPWQ